MRRRGLGSCALGIVVALAVAAPAAGQQPSIVVVLTDDQRHDTIAQMPAVQSELAGQGAVFTNAFVVNPICCPSRASLLTGAYSHTHGVYANRGPFGGFKKFRDAGTIATALQGAGYETGWFGKYLNGYTGTYVPPGWSRWAAFSIAFGSHLYHDVTLNEDGTLVPYTGPRSYSTDLLAAKASDFIREADGPVFVVLAPTAPHAPAIPAPRHEGAFAGMEPWRPPSYNEADISDKPAFARERPLWNAARRAQEDAFHEDQLETLLAVDDAVAELVDALEDTGRMGNTLFVYTSDNGLSWGESRWSSKYVADEPSIRVPLVVRYDPLLSGRRAEERFALNIDLAPTFAELAGIAFPADGRSLAPVLAGDALPWRSDFLVEHMGPFAPPYCALRRTGLKYVQYATGEEELYDLAADPYELENLARRPDHRQLRHAQRVRLRQICDPPPARLPRLGYCTRSGTPKADVMAGTRWFDYVCARGGNDVVAPGAGQDIVLAGDGNDLVRARAGGRDTIDCGRGRDRVVADHVDAVRPSCEVVSRG
jgi:N-acetylglucosamine-6-sulfatase